MALSAFALAAGATVVIALIRLDPYPASTVSKASNADSHGEGFARGTSAALDAKEGAEVAERRLVKLANPTPTSASRPILTLVEHLEQRVASLPWGDGQDRGRQRSPAKDPALVSRSRFYNPQGKTLTNEQLGQVRDILARHEPAIEQAVITEGVKRKDATLRALRGGQFDSVEVPEPSNPLDGAEVKRVRDLERPIVDGLKERLVHRYGRLGTDFIYTMMSSTEPDGVSRRTMIVLSRARDADYFAVLDEQRRLEAARDAELVEFFQKL